MPYTPNGAFNFTDTVYTPDGEYLFGEYDPEGNILATLDGVTADFVGKLETPEGVITAALDDVTAEFVGELELTPEGDIAVTLDDVTSNLNAYIPLEGNILATLDGVTADFQALIVTNLGIFQNVTLDGCTAEFVGEYDPLVFRFTTITNCAAHENTVKLPPTQACVPYEQSTPLNLDKCASYQNGTILFECTYIVNENGTPLNYDLCSVHEEASFLSGLTCFTYEQGTFIDYQSNAEYEQATFLDSASCAVMQQMTKVYPDHWCAVYQDSNRQYDFLHPVMLEPLPPYDDPNSVNSNFTQTNYTPDGNFEFNFGRPSNLQLGHIWGVHSTTTCSDFQRADYHEKPLCAAMEETKYPDPGRTPWIDFPRPDPGPNPPSGDTYIVPRQEVYTMQNTILVTLDDDLTEIDIDELNLSVDADSYTWVFSAQLHDPEQIDLIKQLPDGSAKILHITINGYVWHVLVEKISTTRIFNEQSVSITGRGLTALLGKPYNQRESVNTGSDTDIRVIVDNILPLGWNDLGDLYWLLGDNPVSSPVYWTVDGGAYGYQNKTPIEAIGELARDIGVMVVPSTDSQEIYFKSRYPVLPWSFGLVAVDIAIPDSAILQLTEEPVSSFQANGVYIHGNEIGGELTFVRLNGTAGDRLAPTVNNSLMTNVVGNRHLGERILSGQYAQPKIKSITTFMDGTLVPFIDLGTFVGLTVDGVETRGIVNGSSIDVKFGEVTQTIVMGESTPNVWVSFNELLPKDPMLVGTLSSTDGTTSLMVLLDGGVVRVRGTGSVSAKYYIRSGEIVSLAPNLPYSEIVL